MGNVLSHAPFEPIPHRRRPWRRRTSCDSGPPCGLPAPTPSAGTRRTSLQRLRRSPGINDTTYCFRHIQHTQYFGVWSAFDDITQAFSVSLSLLGVQPSVGKKGLFRPVDARLSPFVPIARRDKQGPRQQVKGVIAYR